MVIVGETSYRLVAVESSFFPLSSLKGEWNFLLTPRFRASSLRSTALASNAGVEEFPFTLEMSVTVEPSNVQKT